LLGVLRTAADREADLGRPVLPCCATIVTMC